MAALSPGNVFAGEQSPGAEPLIRVSRRQNPEQPSPSPLAIPCSFHLARSLSLDAHLRGFHPDHPRGRTSNLCPTSFLPQDTCYTLDWHFHVATCQQAYWKAETLICNCLQHPSGIPTLRSSSSVRQEERRKREGRHQGSREGKERWWMGERNEVGQGRMERRRGRGKGKHGTEGMSVPSASGPLG